jgi:hypothetical protein
VVVLVVLLPVLLLLRLVEAQDFYLGERRSTKGDAHVRGEKA